ncbi:hypothetical protein [Desulfoscipio geothermicus]|uniref:Uncharacterized protein n=1 Tax=Desulfoscipio geothermicus DSM 3669 TaxID=1121426 RepID=A0A1I6ED07_9FIRM|nr:hypothetical protein [Desulfoscipio geothermicus]SFR15623.1 hypothetical protein SAMN05660706_13623 [Desulfoscipio geothermicus DSM 3669]
MAVVTLDRERNFQVTGETIERINDKYGSLEIAVQELKKLNIHAFITVVWALLAEDDPDLTFEGVARLLYARPDIMKQVDEAIVQAFSETNIVEE